MAGERPTLDAVAAAAGVSRMTVSNAYNRPDQLSAATRSRVLEAARTLGYPGPDPAASSLRRGRTDTVGVVLTQRLTYAFTDPGLMTVLHGIATELSDAGSALLLVPSSPDADEPLVRQAIVDALILCAVRPDDPVVDAATSRKLPMVTVGHPQLPSVPCVRIDNSAAAQLVAAHLFRLGHRRFGVVTLGSPDGMPDRRVGSVGMDERATGFAQYLLDAGVAGAAITSCIALENTRDGSLAAVDDMLAMPHGTRPTAVFAVTDVLALGVLDTARRRGIAVPGELSVAGFDDIEAAASSAPPLTTVAQALFERGRTAARLALRMIGGEQVRSPRLVTPELVVRESTAPPPS